MSKTIPLFDLNRTYRPLRKKILKAIERVCDSQQLVMGPVVEKFEKNIASYCKSPHAVSVSCGTEALRMALMVKRIGPGDEVITTPMTFVATAEAIALVGAKPVFCDIDPLTYNLDPACVEKKITPKTKAIIAVHLYGHMGGIEAIKKICQRRKIMLIEDCAQAIGAKDSWGHPAGSIGEMGCFSFYPTKNLGGFGDGGMITAKTASTVKQLKLLRDHGASKKYVSTIVGMNARLDAIQAAVLDIKLTTLNQELVQRERLAKNYQNLFHDANLSDCIQIPFVQPGFVHVYHLYVLRAKKREQLKQHLDKNNIHSGVYYPIPLHLQKCFASLKYKKGSLPEAEHLAQEVLAIPFFPGLRAEEQKRVVHTIQKFYS